MQYDADSWESVIAVNVLGDKFDINMLFFQQCGWDVGPGTATWSTLRNRQTVNASLLFPGFAVV
jgi:hypothetical protein